MILLLHQAAATWTCCPSAERERTSSLTAGTASTGGAAPLGIRLGVLAGTCIGTELQPHRARLAVYCSWHEAGCRDQHGGQVLWGDIPFKPTAC